MNADLTLVVPFGQDLTGRLVPPDDAVPSRAYRCPGCGSPLVLRRGTIRRTHFAHAPDTLCSGETMLHRIAKKLVAQVMCDARDGRGPAPEVFSWCSGCRRPGLRPMPVAFDGIWVEKKLPSGHVADVALGNANTVQVVVEIRVTHAVGSEKLRALAQAGLRVAELRAISVVQDPYRWRPIASTGGRWTCDACRARSGPFVGPRGR